MNTMRGMTGSLQEFLNSEIEESPDPIWNTQHPPQQPPLRAATSWEIEQGRPGMFRLPQAPNAYPSVMARETASICQQNQHPPQQLPQRSATSWGIGQGRPGTFGLPQLSNACLPVMARETPSVLQQNLQQHLLQQPPQRAATPWGIDQGRPEPSRFPWASNAYPSVMARQTPSIFQQNSGEDMDPSFQRDLMASLSMPAIPATFGQAAMVQGFSSLHPRQSLIDMFSSRADHPLMARDCASNFLQNQNPPQQPSKRAAIPSGIQRDRPGAFGLPSASNSYLPMMAQQSPNILHQNSGQDMDTSFQPDFTASFSTPAITSVGVRQCGPVTPVTFGQAAMVQGFASMQPQRSLTELADHPMMARDSTNNFQQNEHQQRQPPQRATVSWGVEQGRPASNAYPPVMVQRSTNFFQQNRAQPGEEDSPPQAMLTASSLLQPAAANASQDNEKCCKTKLKERPSTSKRKSDHPSRNADNIEHEPQSKFTCQKDIRTEASGGTASFMSGGNIGTLNAAGAKVNVVGNQVVVRGEGVMLSGDGDKTFNMTNSTIIINVGHGGEAPSTSHDGGAGDAPSTSLVVGKNVSNQNSDNDKQTYIDQLIEDLKSDDENSSFKVEMLKIQMRGLDHYSLRGYDMDVLRIIETMKTAMALSPQYEPRDVDELFEKAYEKQCFIQSITFSVCAANMYSLMSDANEGIKRVKDCSFNCHDAVGRCFDGQSEHLRQFACDIGMKLQNSVLDMTVSMKNVHPVFKATAVAGCLLYTGFSYNHINDHDNAEKCYKQGLFIMNKQFGSDSSKWGVYCWLVRSLGENHSDMGNYSMAERLFEKTLLICESVEDWLSCEDKQIFVYDVIQSLSYLVDRKDS